MRDRTANAKFQYPGATYFVRNNLAHHYLKLFTWTAIVQPRL